MLIHDSDYSSQIVSDKNFVNLHLLPFGIDEAALVSVVVKDIQTILKFSCPSPSIELLCPLQAKSSNYSATLRQNFPNIQQIDSDVFF